MSAAQARRTGAETARPRVVLLRGHQVNPWDLRPWEELEERFDVACLVTGRNLYDLRPLRVEQVRVRALRDLLPRGKRGELGALLVTDRYLGLDERLASADIVHAAELSTWFSAQAACLKRRHGYKLVLTVWETIPLLGTYRTARARKRRETTLAETDLFLAATKRARDALVLEGIAPERIEICPPGIDVELFAASGSARESDEHLIVSPGRLVWEKGHQDVMRAVAALAHGMTRLSARSAEESSPTRPDDGGAPRALIIGSGPEERRLKSYARELGIADRVEFRQSVPYDEMAGIYARASCMVLASLPFAGGALTGVPRVFWEEQFGIVLAEAMAAGLPVVASASGAIREVAGETVSYFEPGDWVSLARTLAEGPLSQPPGSRVEHPRERVRSLSSEAAAARLAAAYERVLAG